MDGAIQQPNEVAVTHVSRGVRGSNAHDSQLLGVQWE